MGIPKELRERVERIAHLSREAQNGDVEADRREAGYELCYWISELTWGAENLYPPDVARGLVELCPELIRPVLWPHERRYRGLDIGYAAGVTVVWPLKDEAFASLHDDYNFSWKDVGPECMPEEEITPFIYVDNLINIFGTIDAHLKGMRSAPSMAERDDQSLFVLRKLAEHVGHFLPAFRFPCSRHPPRTGESFPKLVAQIDEREHEHSGELSGGQKLVRAFGMRRSNTQKDYLGWSKFGLDLEEVAFFDGAARRRRSAKRFARWTKKCVNCR